MMLSVSEFDALRRRLSDALRSSADFDAFCIDYFPLVYQRFGEGMDRTQKTNILFEQVGDHLKINHALNAKITINANLNIRKQTAHRLWFLSLLFIIVTTIGFIFIIYQPLSVQEQNNKMKKFAPLKEEDNAVPQELRPIPLSPLRASDPTLEVHRKPERQKRPVAPLNRSTYVLP
jgi:hypothetical protein